jgi:hypothetical protein
MCVCVWVGVALWVGVVGVVVVVVGVVVVVVLGGGACGVGGAEGVHRDGASVCEELPASEVDFFAEPHVGEF